MTAPEATIDHEKVFALSSEMLCVLDLEGRLCDVNPAWERALGLAADELIGKSIADLVHEAERRTVVAELTALAQSAPAGSAGAGENVPPAGSSPRRFLCRITGKDAAPRWLSFHAARVPDEPLIVASAHDVTEQIRGLRRFKALLDAAPDFVAITSRGGRALYLNPAGLALIGRKGQDPTTLDEDDLLADDAPFAPPSIARPTSLRTGIWAGEAELKHATGSVIPVSLVSVKLRNELGAHDAFGTVATDLRWKRRAHTHMRRLRALLSATPDFVAIARPDGVISYINPAGLALVGREERELHALKLTDLFTEADVARYERSIAPAIGETGLWAGELHLKRPGADPIPVSQVILGIRSEAGALEAIGAIGRDLSEQKAMERSLTQALRALSTPIIEVWDGVVALPIIGRVDTVRAAELMDSLLATIARTQCSVAILDLTGTPTIDPATVCHLFQVVSAASLLGSRCVISGIAPEVARTIVEQDLELPGLSTFGTLEAALRFAMRIVADEQKNPERSR